MTCNTCISAASEADNASVSDTGGDICHDSCSLKLADASTLNHADASSLKIAFHGLAGALGKVSPPSPPHQKDAPAALVSARAGDKPSNSSPLNANQLSNNPSNHAQPLPAPSVPAPTTDRFAGQQPMARASAARRSFPPHPLPAAAAISLIPVPDSPVYSPVLAPTAVGESREGGGGGEVEQAQKVRDAAARARAISLM